MHNTYIYMHTNIYITHMHRLRTTSLHLFNWSLVVEINIIDIQVHHFWGITIRKQNRGQLISAGLVGICRAAEEELFWTGYNETNASADSVIHQVNCACSLYHVVYLLLSQLKVNSLFLQVDFLKLVRRSWGPHTPLPGFLMDTLITVEAD